MKQVAVETREAYTYETYDEFVQHYSTMILRVFKACSESSRPNYYVNHDMPEYFAEYYKKLI